MTRERAILHSDINCCYAQIECQEHPELRGHPVAVGGMRRPGTASCSPETFWQSAGAWPRPTRW